MERGDFEKASLLAAECLTTATAGDDGWFQSWPLGIRAFIALHHRDYTQASELFEQLLAVARQTGDSWLVPGQGTLVAVTLDGLAGRGNL